MEFLIVAILIGLIPAAIAQSKGKNFVAWWLYGASLFIVALPHSLLIGSNKPDAQQIERDQIQSGTSRKCPFCAETIKAEAIVCRYCSRDLPTEVPRESRSVKPPEKIIDEEELDQRMKQWREKWRQTQ